MVLAASLIHAGGGTKGAKGILGHWAMSIHWISERESIFGLNIRILNIFPFDVSLLGFNGINIQVSTLQTAGLFFISSLWFLNWSNNWYGESNSGQVTYQRRHWTYPPVLPAYPSTFPIFPQWALNKQKCVINSLMSAVVLTHPIERINEIWIVISLSVVWKGKKNTMS